MKCKYCSQEIIADAPYCPWCGKRIHPLCAEEALFLAKELRRSPSVDFTRAIAIYIVWRENLYMPQYANIEEFDKNELHLKRAMTQNYKVIGRDYVDDNGNLLFTGNGNWSLGQVNELKALSLKQINQLISENMIHSEMQCDDIRAAIRAYFE